jgi:ribosomal protein S18 acetylase RimI-like enzyme
MTKFEYVEMVCELDQKQYREGISMSGMVIEPIGNIATETLFECYINAFDEGDAKFFKLQNEGERRRYYDEELGFPEILTCPASFAYKIKDELIGFSFVLPYLENNYHISCMCIRPEYRDRGIGKAMLNRIKNIALENGCKTLTLGTEPEMKAYQLYQNHGFTVTAEHTVEM